MTKKKTKIGIIKLKANFLLFEKKEKDGVYTAIWKELKLGNFTGLAPSLSIYLKNKTKFGTLWPNHFFGLKRFSNQKKLNLYECATFYHGFEINDTEKNLFIKYIKNDKKEIIPANF